MLFPVIVEVKDHVSKSFNKLTLFCQSKSKGSHMGNLFRIIRPFQRRSRQLSVILENHNLTSFQELSAYNLQTDVGLVW